MNILLIIYAITIIFLIGSGYGNSKTIGDKLRLASIPIFLAISLKFTWFIASCWKVKDYMVPISSIQILTLPPVLYCLSALIVLSIYAWKKEGYRNLNGFKNVKGLGDECPNGAMKWLSEGLIYGILYGIPIGTFTGLLEGLYNISHFQKSMIEGIYSGLSIALLITFFTIGVYGAYRDECKQ